MAMHATGAGAATFKCNINGRTSFQDLPCPGARSDENRLEVRVHSGSAPAPEAASMGEPAANPEQESQATEFRHRIRTLEAENLELQRQMDEELAQSREDGRYANSNPAGTTGEVPVVAARYETRIKANKARIGRLNERLDSLGKSP
ncbi:MAG TPA: hypothetical protein VLI06_19165 [Solimonas sp.]|nr:hypothetical protein [Solimonas sp.]